MAISRNELQRALFAWLSDACPARLVAASGTFRSDRKITRSNVDGTLRMFARKLDREVLGSRDRDGKSKRLSFVPLVEGHERHGPPLHWHGIIEVPDAYTEAEFISLCKRIWRSLNLSGEQLRFEPVSSRLGWLDYITKRRTKGDIADALVVQAMHLPA